MFLLGSPLPTPRPYLFPSDHSLDLLIKDSLREMRSAPSMKTQEAKTHQLSPMCPTERSQDLGPPHLVRLIFRERILGGILVNSTSNAEAQY